MNMHAMNMWLTDASGRWLDFAPMASQQWWGVTAGQVRHNSSNVGGVTAGQVRHNSSVYNTQETQLSSKSEITDRSTMLRKQTTVANGNTRNQGYAFVNTGKAVPI